MDACVTEIGDMTHRDETWLCPRPRASPWKSILWFAVVLAAITFGFCRRQHQLSVYVFLVNSVIVFIALVFIVITKRPPEQFTNECALSCAFLANLKGWHSGEAPTLQDNPDTLLTIIWNYHFSSRFHSYNICFVCHHAAVKDTAETTACGCGTRQQGHPLGRPWGHRYTCFYFFLLIFLYFSRGVGVTLLAG